MNLLQLDFWFNLRPIPLLPFYNKALIAFTGLLLVLAIISFFIKKQYKKSAYRRATESIFSLTTTNFFLGLLILFFNYERIPLMSARFWLILWVIEMAIWIYFIVKGIKTLPQKQEETQREKEYKKYLP